MAVYLFSNANVKVNLGKFKTRYSAFKFQDSVGLDGGEIWPVSFALQTWSPAVEKKVTEVVKAAVS